MPRHAETRFLPYTAGQMFDLVADVERYPEFLPWCERLIVRERGLDPHGREIIVARLDAHYRMVRESFTSRVRLERAHHAIHVDYIDGPFEHLANDWRFEPHPRGCRVHFAIDFAFRSRLLSGLAATVFGAVVTRMADAFEARAHVIYGQARAAQN